MKRFCLTILSAILLSSCADGARLELPPADLARCAPEPEAPALTEMDWSSIPAAQETFRARGVEVTGWLADLYRAGGDCRAKVKGLKAWRDKAGD